MRNKIAFFATICVLLVACNSDKKGAKPPSPPTNIIVILDVSDRLSKDKSPGQERQAERDIKIAKGIIEIFEKQFVRRSRYIGSHHRLAFVVPEQPGTSEFIPQETLESLKIWPTPQDRLKGAPRFKEMKAQLVKAIEKLYAFIEQRDEFTGSNIWGWFDVSAEAYLQPNAHNYIICISDGYLYLNTAFLPLLPSPVGNKAAVIRHAVVGQFSRDPKWEAKFEREGHGLLSIGEDFSRFNPKFLMVEVGRRDLQLKDLPILKKYWAPWLLDMGIEKVKFLHTQDDPGVVIQAIQDFIN